MFLTETVMNVQHPPLAQQIEMWPIDKLVAYANNPRKNDAAVDGIAASIRSSGSKSRCRPAVTARWWTGTCGSKQLGNWDSCE